MHSHPRFPADNAFSMEKKTPSRREAMRAIVNVLKEDPATDKGNMHKIWQRSRVWFWRYPRGQTDRHTDRHILITILRNRSRGRSNNRIDSGSMFTYSMRSSEKNTSRQYLTIVQYHEGETTGFGHSNLRNILTYKPQYLQFCTAFSKRVFGVYFQMRDY